MLFSKLSAVVLGLAAFATASPVHVNHALAVRGPSAVERGLVWTPRSLQTRSRRNRNDKKNNIIIAQPVNIQLNQIQIIQEVQIVNVIQNIIVIDDGGRDDARDNVRRNHYRNRNRDRDVNIVVIVVVVVIDARDGNNQNIRYLTRHVESNPEIENKEWVVVTEQSTLTVDNQNPTAAGAAPTGVAPPEAFATGAVGSESPQVAVWDPAAPLQLNSSPMLLPAGIEAPRWDAARQDQDPAVIIEADQLVFVAFLNGDDNENDNKGDDDDNNKGDDNDRGDRGDGDRQGNGGVNVVNLGDF